MIWGCPDPPTRATRTLSWVLLKHQLFRYDRSKALTMSLRSSWIWMMIKARLPLQVNKLEHGLAGKETSCAQVDNTPADTGADASAEIVGSTTPASPSQKDQSKPMTVLQQDDLFEVSLSRFSSYIPLSVFTGTVFLLTQKLLSTKIMHCIDIDSCQKPCTTRRTLSDKHKQPDWRIWDLLVWVVASLPPVPPSFIVLSIHLKYVQKETKKKTELKDSAYDLRFFLTCHMPHMLLPTWDWFWRTIIWKRLLVLLTVRLGKTHCAVALSGKGKMFRWRR